PVALDAHPKHEVALGAARAGGPDAGSVASVEAAPPARPDLQPPAPPRPGGPAAPGPRRSRRTAWLVAAAAAVLAVGGTAYALWPASSPARHRASSSPTSSGSPSRTAAAVPAAPLPQDDMIVPRLEGGSSQHVLAIMSKDGKRIGAVQTASDDPNYPVLSHD